MDVLDVGAERIDTCPPIDDVVLSAVERGNGPFDRDRVSSIDDGFDSIYFRFGVEGCAARVLGSAIHRRAVGEDVFDEIWAIPGDLPNEHTAVAPADQAGWLSGRLNASRNSLDHRSEHLFDFGHVLAESPADAIVSEMVEKAPQWGRREIVGAESRYDEHVRSASGHAAQRCGVRRQTRKLA